ncbi:hypothetical protein FH972_015408 [Carpinus fangiana]|uniref:Phylloplanin-like n=1 Tax=Carpinus fangiana TaxID=176857 RepID=A0A5N6RG89_9ROSI|nr:hypothetical protein FH972_015408 [Carpinus fangiana]
MALKLALFVFVVIAAVAAPLSKAQSQTTTGLVGLIRINGTVFCSLNGNIGANSTVFPNALVQLRCGAGNIVLSIGITNGSGVFVILLLDPLGLIAPTVVPNCKLVVATPLSTCKASLPMMGTLQSPLQLVGTTSGLIPVTNFKPAGFVYNPAT